MPVGSIAREIPFQEAIIEYFCLAVRGRRGSTAAGAAGGGSLLEFPPPPLLVSFPSSQPILEGSSPDGLEGHDDDTARQLT